MSIVQSLKRNVQLAGHSTATLYGHRRQSWIELQERVARLAAGFASLGASDGKRIAILALNSDRYLECYFAAAWAGAVIVPLNTRWSAEEIVYSLRDSDATVLLVDDAFLNRAIPLCGDLNMIQSIAHIGDTPPPSGLVGYEALIEAHAAIPDHGSGGEDLAGVFYTGGSTGFPKGVMLSHRSLWSSAMAYLAVDRRGAERVWLHAAPMFHLGDASSMIAGTLSGDTQAIIPFFTPEGVLAAIERFRVTDTVLVPTMLKMLIWHPSISSSDVSSLRLVGYGGSAIDESTLFRALDVLPNCQFLQAYGQTELSPIATILGPEYHVRDGPNAGKLASAGRAALCNEIEIVNPDGAQAPSGSVGELRSRGPNGMLGYWKKPEETAAVFRDGWVYTGDAAYIDKDGFVYIVDRLKDVVVTGGESVYSAEVEQVLCRHLAIEQCAVFGIPSDKWGEAVHAIVILREDHQVSADEIIAHCRRQLAHYKCPSSVEFRARPFPLSGAGKVLKRELRKPYWQDRSREVN